MLFLCLILDCYVILAEILRVSGMISNQGFSDYDRLQRGSPSPLNSLDIMPDVGPKGLGRWNGNGWNGLQHEVSTSNNQMYCFIFIFLTLVVQILQCNGTIFIRSLLID